MRTTLLMALGCLALVPATSVAQVSGTIVVGGLPVGGMIQFGPQPYAYYRPRPRMLYGYAPRVIVVERWRGHKHGDDFRHMRWGTVWYDRMDGRYYDGYRPGLVEIRVYEREGRYYQPYDGRDDDRYDDRRERHRGRDRDDWYDPDRR